MISKVEKHIAEMGLSIPDCPAPVASYQPVIREGNTLYTSGQTAWVDGKMMFRGKVGKDLSVEEAQESAKYCALNCISALKTVADLDHIRILKVLGFVNADPLFQEHPKVMEGASKLLIDAFGEKGYHSRSAIGVGSLPSNASIEVEIVAWVEEE